MRPRFFIDEPSGTPPGSSSQPSPGQVVELPSVDAHHARAVLRARAGDIVELVFPASRVVTEGVVEAVDPVVTVRVTAVESESMPARLEVLLVQGLCQPRKIDEVVEKGTEVGVDSFLIVPAAGSPDVPLERLEARLERWCAIAREAAKQSKQLAVPPVRVAEGLHIALRFLRAEGWASIVLDTGAPEHLRAVLEDGMELPWEVCDHRTPPARLALWVGPEGGWTDDEVKTLAQGGARPAHLGRRVLRTETAGAVAGALTRGFLSDW